MKKTKSKHFLCYIFKTSKTLRLRCSTIRKISKKFAETTNETVKKNKTAQLHQKLCKKSRHMQHHGAFVFARLLLVWS